MRTTTPNNPRRRSRRLAHLLALAVAATALLAPAAQAGLADEQADEEFIPFVTDFPKTETAAPSGSGGVDWSGVGLAGGLGATAAAVLAGASLRRRA